MYLIISIIVTSVSLANNYNEELISVLFDDSGWQLKEMQDETSIYTKNIEDITLDAIMVSKTISFPAQHTLDIIKNIKNYNTTLVNSSNVKTEFISNNNDKIIAFQSIEIPILSDLYYFFKMYDNTDLGNSVVWILEDSDQYLSEQVSKKGFALEVGCGGWDYIDNGDGTFKVNYRLIMDITGYPRWAVNYINYYSILNVFNDVVLAASQLNK
jgi:hypothetical protein